MVVAKTPVRKSLAGRSQAPTALAESEQIVNPDLSGN